MTHSGTKSKTVTKPKATTKSKGKAKQSTAGNKHKTSDMSGRKYSSGIGSGY